MKNIGFKVLFLAFAILIVATLSNLVVSSRTVLHNKEIIEEVNAHITPYLNELGEFKLMISQSKMWTTNWVYLQSNIDDKNSLKELHEENYPQLKQKIQAFMPRLSSIEQAELDSLFNNFENLLFVEEEVMMTLGSFDDYQDPATLFMMEEVVETQLLPMSATLDKQLETIISKVETQQANGRAEMQEALDLMNYMVPLLGGVIFIAVLFAGFYVFKYITIPIVEVKNILHKLSEGLLPNIEVENQTSVIGEMVEALGKMRNNLYKTTLFAEEIGKGNYGASHQPLSDEDILGKALLNMKESLYRYATRMEETIEDRTRSLEIKTKELDEAYQDILASEEELRQNAEELLALNDNLNEEKMQVEKAMAALQKAQRELVQSEKMASLGQLTAGVAHEINNPVNYISGGAQNIQLIVGDLIDMLEAYSALEKPSTEEDRQEVLSRLNAMAGEVGGIDELKEDAQLMIGDIMKGVDRVTEIVKGLSNFARGDADKRQKADIHELVNSALVILNNKYKDRIEIVKEFAEDSPVILCYPGPLSQVFMNLVNNAIDAIPDKGKITISTKNKADELFISIRDTGSGIPSELLVDIFNPFFTTKDVGKGTGLGLSIVHGIIEKHEGTIGVESTVGEGTVFTIKLPKNDV